MNPHKRKKKQGTEILCLFLYSKCYIFSRKKDSNLPDQPQALGPPIIVVTSDGDFPACLISRSAVGRTCPRIPPRSRKTMLLCCDHDLCVLAWSNENIPDLQAFTSPEIHLVGNIPEAISLPLLFHGLSVRVCRNINPGFSVACSHEAAAGVIRITSPGAGSVVISMPIIIAYLFRFPRSFFGDRQSNHALSH